jgi:Domain of unknown function (DUF3943)
MLKRLFLGLICLGYLQCSVAANSLDVNYTALATPLVEEPKDTRYQKLFHKSLYLGVYQFMLLYGMTRLPEKVTKWSDEQRQFKNFGRNWAKHVRSSPVFDRDPLWVNFIGHPWGGAGYYTMARQTGLSPKEAFFYSFLESTLVWEYGFEAMVEHPSVQDLFITPAIGSIFGELKYREIQRIKADDGRLWGSETYGRIAIVLLSPYNALVEATQGLFHDTDQPPEVYSQFTVHPGQGHHAGANRYSLQLHVAI